MTAIPGWYDAVLLALAAWRVFHLLAHDDVLNRPRRYVTRLSKSWRADGDPTGPGYRQRLAEFLSCPYCLGFWAATGWWAAWLAWPTQTVWLAVPLALNAALVGAQRLLSSE